MAVDMHDSSKNLFTVRTALAALALVVAFVGALYLEGRPAVCKTGFALWSAAWTSCTSQHLLDPYSLSHVLHGVILFWLLRPLADRVSLPWRMVAAMAIEIGWEVLENSPWIVARYRQETAALDYTGDSMVNALGDLASAIVGFAIAARFSWKVAVALFVVLELWMLWLARDNLTLNVLMLLHPIEAIKQWQLAGTALHGPLS
jgi:Protein of unknown function (DUF2585)